MWASLDATKGKPVGCAGFFLFSEAWWDFQSLGTYANGSCFSFYSWNGGFQF